MNKINIENEFCKACGICIAFCPRQVYDTGNDGKPLVSRLEDCIGCKFCQLRCPDFAIKVEVNK